MKLLLIRHGESTGNADGRLQGHLDLPLSERGRMQSERLAERLAGASIDVLFTSPLSRARQTADLIVALHEGLEPVEREGLMERNVGELAGLTGQEIRARYPAYVRAREQDLTDVPVAGFEANDEFGVRGEEVFRGIIDSHADGNVAVVAHGGVISAFCRQVLGLGAAWPTPFSLDNCGVTSLSVRNGEPGGDRPARMQIATLNDTCHLDGM